MIDKKIWDTIGGKKQCSFKIHTKTAQVCKNKYNLTGLCDEFSCPLANPEYATIRLIDQEIFLYVKNSEKLDKPAEVWEETNLGYDYTAALKTLEEKLKDYDENTLKRCKQKMTYFFECLVRMNEINEAPQEQLVVRKKKMNRREKVRALKALNTINFEKEIGEELMQRLKEGVYGEERKDMLEMANEQAKNHKKKIYVADIEDSETKKKKKKTVKKSGKKKETIEW